MNDCTLANHKIVSKIIIKFKTLISVKGNCLKESKKKAYAKVILIAYMPSHGLQ